MADELGLDNVFDNLDNETLLDIGKWQYRRSLDLMKTLNKFRKDGESGFCDVNLEVEGKDFPAHRCVLAANSQFFYTMFNSGMRESAEKSLKLHSVSSEAMVDILEFFYTQTIVLKEDTLLDILDASCFLLLSALKKACLEMLSSRLSIDNCFSTKHLAAKYNADELFTKTESFIKMNFLQLGESSEDFLDISAEELSELLCGDDIRVESESQVFLAVIRWAKHDLPSRQRELPSLLQKVRLHLLSEAFLKDQLEKEIMALQTPKCEDIIRKFLKKSEQQESAALSELVLDSERTSTKDHNILVGVGIGECHRVFCYDVEDQQTLILPNLPQVQAFPCVVEMDKMLYILGGESQKNIHYDPVNSMRTFPFEISKISSGKRVGWRRKASFREVRRDHAIVTHDSKIYVLGGWMSGPIRSVECYDCNSGNWSMVAPLHIPRSQLAAIATNTHIIAIGGSTDQVTGTNIIEQFNPTCNTWQFLPTMNTRRVFANVAFLHEKVYVLGGYDNVFERISACEVFDPITCDWSTIASLPDTLSTNQSVVVLNNEIIAITGSQDSYCNAAWYNSHADVWEKVKNFAAGINIAGYRLCCLQVKKFYLQDLPDGCTDVMQGNQNLFRKQDIFFEENDPLIFNATELGLSLSDDNSDGSDSDEDYFFL